MSKATRQAFGESLEKLGETHPEIVVLDADLSKSTMSKMFAKKYPERFFEMGIQEANMIGVAAGMSFMGKLPFLCSFGCFLTGRYDTIRLSVAYAQANVRLIGTHAGVGIGDDGHSQMGLEDISLMRALPTMGVFQPMDTKETEQLMNFLVKTWKGPAYIRLTRQKLPDLYPADAKFDPLKLLRVHQSGGSGQKRVALIGSGAGVAEAVNAAKKIESQLKSIEVWNACSLKPFDGGTLAKIASNNDLLLTVEDHSIIGGLGTCVAETLATMDKHPQLIKLGVQDIFGQSGEPAELYDLYGISANAVAKTIQSCL